MMLPLLLFLITATLADDLFPAYISEITHSDDELHESAARVKDTITNCMDNHWRVCSFNIAATKESRKIIPAELRKRYTAFTYKLEWPSSMTEPKDVPLEGVASEAMFHIRLYG